MKKFEHGGNIYEKRPEGAEWLDFSANINPLGLALSARKAIESSIEDLVHYPDPEARELREAIAGHYNVPLEGVVAGNGAAELFYLFLQTVRPRRVLLPVPSFSEYERAALAARCQISYFQLNPEEDFRIDWVDFMGALPVADCVILGNPNNPTGSLLTRNELVRALEMIKNGNQWVVIDESFLDFLTYDNRYSVRDLAAEYPRLFVVQSLTKFFALPGLRLGFGVACAELAKRLNDGKDAWNVNLLAQKAGAAVLRDREYQKQSRDFIAAEAQHFYQCLAKCPGIRAYQPSVNFILLDVSALGLDSTEFSARMKAKWILVRDCANYSGLDGRSFVRIAVRQRADNEQFLHALEDL